MRCPSCSFDNPDQFKFCGQCGAQLIELLRVRLPEPAQSEFLRQLVERRWQVPLFLWIFWLVSRFFNCSRHLTLTHVRANRLYSEANTLQDGFHCRIYMLPYALYGRCRTLPYICDGGANTVSHGLHRGSRLLP